MTLAPLFADGIDLPIVLFYGVAVLVPLLLFEVLVEGAILSRIWHIPFRQLAKPVLWANCWSLLAGIPTKFFNAAIYEYLLPNDLAGYFARYAFAATVGTLIYYVITVLVETISLSRWLKRERFTKARTKIWLAVLIANAATYAVLGPLHYFATQPITDVTEFTTNTQWAKQPPTRLVYIDSATGYLKSIFSDGSTTTTLVPISVKDYLITSNLNLVLFHDQQGIRRLYLVGRGETEPADAEHMLLIETQATFGSDGNRNWGGEDSFGDLKAWAEPGLGNQIRLYRTNDFQRSLLRVAINPGLLHFADFRFTLSHPAFISDGKECLFQAQNAIYLLDIERKCVGKLADGRNFILLTPTYAKRP